MCLCVQFAAVIYSKDPQAPKYDLRPVLLYFHNESTTADKHLDFSDII